jgi:hypothetical protein
MKKVSFSLALFVAVSLSLTIAAVRSIAAQQRPANGPVPLERLSVEERAKTSPDSTVVQFRNKTFTLGQLRAAHQMRTTSWAKAQANGVLAAQNLNRQQPRLVTGKTGATDGRINLDQPQGPTFHQPAAHHGGIPNLPTPQWVTEPASDYASVPADMKAFCAAAAASACLYLPPQQEIDFDNRNNTFAFNYDELIDHSQCTSEGGSWQQSGNQGDCMFSYPQSVTVTFTPPPNFQISSTAQCDQSVFTYQVDIHGAVAISMKQLHTGYIIPGPSTWCVVRVKLGN